MNKGLRLLRVAGQPLVWGTEKGNAPHWKSCGKGGGTMTLGLQSTPLSLVSLPEWLSFWNSRMLEHFDGRHIHWFCLSPFHLAPNGLIQGNHMLCYTQSLGATIR